MASEVDYSNWIGRSEKISDTITSRPARFMQATLGTGSDPVSEGDALPLLWHWLYFLKAETRSNLGRDGHPKRGGFLPPVNLPRRMWAGGRFVFTRPLRIGSTATRSSTIKSIMDRNGRSGPLCFVTVRHDISDQDGQCLSEEHDIVFREDPDPSSPAPTSKPAPDGAVITEIIIPDPTLLFRYSALTFNGHRIHYDRDYAREVEGYRDLVFHGPLTATLLADMAQRRADSQPLKTFSFRALAPLFVDRQFTINAGRSSDNSVDLWATTPDGNLAVEANACW